MTVAGATISLCLLVSFAQCSSIITRSMIKMPTNSSSSSFEVPVSRSGSPEAALLRANPDVKKYEIVYSYSPTKDTGSEVQSRSMEVALTPPTVTEEDFSKSNKVTGLDNFTKPLQQVGTKKNSTRREYDKRYREEFTSKAKPETPHEDESEQFNFTLTPEELSSKYWMQYKNFSYDFFNHSESPQTSTTEPTIDKGHVDVSVWEMMRRMYHCVWSSGLVSCLQQTFRESEFLPYLQLLMPRLPRFLQEGGTAVDYNSYNDKFDFAVSDQDEGRKKLSQKLQQFLPALMLLKLTMLPALAVMALVSGKAFLLSLLSLGVALVAASVNPLGLSASKRQEIASQSTIPTDPVPSNYYYVM